jgi:hypothetical protein
MKPTLPKVSYSSKSLFRVSLTATLLAAASLVPLSAVAQDAGAPTTAPDEPVQSEVIQPNPDLPLFSQTGISDPAAMGIPPATDSGDVQILEAQNAVTIQSDTVSLSAIPPRVGEDRNLKGKPGETIQTVIRVKNNSDEPLPVTSIVQDFIIGEDGFTPIPVFDETSNRWSLASWVTISPEAQTIAPNQSGNVNVVINVPEDALPGGHYAMVLHEPSVGGAGGEGAQSKVGQRVGTLLYFFVDGPITEEAFVRNFEFQNLTEYGPVPFSYTVENMSDIHITPRTSITIHNIFGTQVDEITIEPKNVFPLMSRAFDGEWARVWGSGYYTARLTMNYGENGQVVLATDQFWLLPYRLIAATGVGILAVIAILLLIRRQMVNRNRRERETIEMLEKRLEEIENGTSDTTKPEDKPFNE